MFISYNKNCTCRQIIAYKNLIEAIENLSISIAIGFFFFVHGKLGAYDYGEYIKAESLALDHLQSANHFLQDLHGIFDASESDQLNEWYFKIVETTINKPIERDIFGNRRKVILNKTSTIDEEMATNYYDFMHKVVLMKIEALQSRIKNDIR